MALKPKNNVFASPFLEGATFAGKYEFPEVAPVHIQHLSAIPYDKISRKLREKSPLWVHHYVFDTRFQPMLKDPDDLYKHLQMYAGVIGLDNSLYRDMPLAEQIQSIFLNRLFDFRWQRLGMQVIPNVVWGDQRSVLVTLKPYKWHFVFLWFLLGALPPNPWSFSGIGTSGESLKEAVFSRHRPGFRPFVHPAIP